MSQYTIWHNPRCSKSRQTLQLLEENNIEAEVVKYLELEPNEASIKEVLEKLNISAKELLRDTEEQAKILKLKEVDDEATIIEAMSKYPKLIQRPIVIKGDKAVLGRPPEKVLELI